jgi:hypothetical protein
LNLTYLIAMTVVTFLASIYLMKKRLIK